MLMLDNKKLLKYHHLKDKVNQVFNASWPVSLRLIFDTQPTSGDASTKFNHEFKNIKIITRKYSLIYQVLYLFFKNHQFKFYKSQGH
jgi:hypothetical protein